MRNAWCETCIVYVRTATSRTPLTEVSRQRSETKKAANIPKMRYPSHDTPCQPLISPDEVRRGESSYEVTQILNPETYKVPDAPQRSINGLCCDCCHGCCAKGPCGRFPFLGVGNQFLTPLQYANLARLGHDLAAAPLAELVEARAAATRRKSSPAAALITRKRAEESSSRF